MKNFFKISTLKIVISIILVILDIFSRLAYARGISVVSGNIEFQGNAVINILYWIMNAILFPIKEFGRMLGASGKITSLSFSFIIFIIIYIFYIYIISSIISFFITRMKKEGPSHIV